MTALELQLERIAHAPRLLVACDYDGVIAPITANPTRAFPSIEMVECLDQLAAIRQTDIAVVSGRSIESLRSLLKRPLIWHLIGSHGAEWDREQWAIANRVSHNALQPVLEQLREMSKHAQGTEIEEKPYGVAFHYRNAQSGLIERLMPHLNALANDRSGLVIRHGKKVVEFSIT